MKKTIVTFLILCILSIAGCQPYSPLPKNSSENPPENLSENNGEKEILTIKDFYPFLENHHLSYDGIGIEYAERETYFDFVTKERAQIRNKSTGTTVIQILDYEEGSLKLKTSHGESYFLTDYTSGDFKGEMETLLMEPIQVGTKWELPDGRTREITAIDASIETPSGNYKALEVTTERHENTKTKTYYAKGLGMVHTIFQGEGFEIITTLANINKNTHNTYNLRCYYPDIENERIVYKDVDIDFNTNDRIEPIYTEHLQIALGESIPSVLKENVTIKSFSYDPDQRLVTVDLSGNFAKELNAGSGFESLIIQSIVNTVGWNFGVDKIIITLDGKLYESGHFILLEGDHFSTNYENTVPFES